MEKHIKAWFIILASSIIALAILVTALRAEGMTPEDSDKVIELIRKGELTEKQAIVSDVKHEELRWPKYTIRVGRGGARKPIPAIKGLTTQERAKEWLEKAWLGHTLNAWIMFWEQDRIDYTLPICVAWADSHLWKALASKNNIGNVGNDDRGRRVEYKSMEDWINAIFRALNNKWMGGNEVIGQLSGEGRKRLWIEGCKETKVNEKCYATSMWVWSTNVTNCMSVIHNEQIDEKYMFRIYSMEDM